MDIKQELKLLDKEQNSVEKKYKKLEQKYQQYITNKDIPVLERWEFFINSSDKLKDSFNGVATFQSKLLQGYMQSFENGPGSPRGEKIVMEDVLADYVHPDITQEELDYLAENYLCCDTLTKEDVEEAIEEVLSMNLAHFTYDW